MHSNDSNPAAVFKPINPLLTDKEAGAYLNLSTSTLAVWRCTRRQELPFIKLGRAVRYRQADLDKWLESRTVGPSQGEA